MIYPDINNYSDILLLDGEEWRDIESHKGLYQVSNLGRVKRLQTTRLNSNQHTSFQVIYKEKIIRASPETKGYPQVALNFNVKRVARVHRLVAEAFLDPPSDEIVAECVKAGIDYVPINHKDSNTFNAKVSNLEWCSPSRNILHSVQQNRYNRPKGSKVHNAALTESDVVKIVEMLDNKEMSQEKIAEIYGVKQITISNIWTGRSWNHVTGFPVVKRHKKNAITS